MLVHGLRILQNSLGVWILAPCLGKSRPKCGAWVSEPDFGYSPQIDSVSVNLINR